MTQANEQGNCCSLLAEAKVGQVCLWNSAEAPSVLSAPSRGLEMGFGWKCCPGSLRRMSRSSGGGVGLWRWPCVTAGKCPQPRSSEGTL